MIPLTFLCFIMLLMFENNSCEINYRDILTNMTTTTKKQLSPQCEQDLNDASISTLKLLSDYSSSSLVPMGNYDKCLEIEEVETKFCEAFGDHLNQDKSSLQQLTPEKRKFAKKMKLFSGELQYCVCKSCNLYDLSVIFNGSAYFMLYDRQCSSKDSEQDLDHLAITAIVIFASIGLVTVLSTLYDIYLVYSGSSPIHSTLIAFSLWTNGKQLFHLGNSQQLQCLNGMKSLSMFWVVFFHVHVSYTLIPLDNYVDWFKWLDSAANQYVTGGTLAVDTFLTIGGFLTIYTFQASMDKDAKFNLPLYYFHRYWRLTPALAAMVLANAALFNFLGSGPLWQRTELILAKPCRNHWWSVLLYIQNYVNPEEICIPQSWYLSVDMQLFAISPLLLVMLRRRPLWGYTCLTIVSLFSIIDTFFIGWFYKLYGQFFAIAASDNAADFLYHYYYPTHTRMLPYLFGMMLGHSIYRLKTSEKAFKMNLGFVLSGWVLSLGLMAACIFVGNTLQLRELDRWGNSFYIALMRPTWTIATCWVIFACVTGHGGLVNKFLSLPVFQISSRFCYSVYLVHLPFIFLTTFTIRSPLHFSDYDAFHKYLGDLGFTIGIAISYYLVFETPFVALEKVLRRKRE